MLAIWVPLQMWNTNVDLLKADEKGNSVNWWLDPPKGVYAVNSIKPEKTSFKNLWFSMWEVPNEE